MKLLKKSVLVLLVGSLVGCGTVPMPSNVSTRPGNESGDYINAVDFSYQSAATKVNFNKLKLCVAENVSNNSVQLRDASRSFVGPATGHYYNLQNSQTVQGGEIFKYSDPTLSTLIAIGTVDSPGMVEDIIKYELKVSVNQSRVHLIFSNITRAQKSTGLLANDGFGPVGTWPGARTMQSYTALQGVANGIKLCLQ